MIENMFFLCCPVSPAGMARWPLTFIAFMAIAVGYMLYKDPEKSIRFQIEFYRRINWRMEPIDLKKEIRSTRMMGLVGLFCGIGSLVALFLKSR